MTVMPPQYCGRLAKNLHYIYEKRARRKEEAVSGEQRRPAAFMFTDIEGSTQLWHKHFEAMKQSLPHHDAILDAQITRYGGRIIKHTGDGIYAVFEGGDPLQCALAIQRQFQREDCGPIGKLRIRVALHVGHAEKGRGDDYFGPVINRVARVLSTGWGGQTLLTPEAVSAFPLPEGATLQDLGVHVLKDLSEPQQIYGLLHPDLPLQQFPALRSLSARPNNLPPQTTPFVGREEELAEMRRLLQDPACRLLTLVGPGGAGKTRLALHAAAQQIETFTHGVYFVSLDAVRTTDSLPFAIADAIKFTFYSRENPDVQLLNYLREKEMLLLLDNFEHLLEGTDLLAGVLQQAPQVKFIVTSRERLNLQEEWVLDIQGLKLPTADGVESSSAVQFFVQSAQRVYADFSLSEDDKPHVVRICQLVEALPLGIELAAAWVRMLPCREIAQEIEQNLDFLATKLRNVQERHRSLRAVFEHSWKLLSESEREIFRKLSVFRGGFSREAAQQVAGATLPLLSALLDKSLLRRSCTGRHVAHELLRQYADEKLQEDLSLHEQIYEKHCSYYAEFLTQREEALKRTEQKETLEEIQEEFENIQGSWAWAVDHGRTEALDKALSSLHLFYDRRSRFQEGVAALQSAITALRSKQGLEGLTRERTLLGKLLSRQGMFCHRLGLYERARGLLEEGFTLARAGNDPAEQALSLNNLGSVAEAVGQYPEAKRLYEESLTLRRRVGDRWAIALSLNNLGNLAYRLGDYLEARKLYEESLAIKRETGDRKGTAPSLNNLGNVAMVLGQYPEAKKLYEESIAIKRELGDQWGLSLSLNNLGLVSEALGEYSEAEKLYQESLGISREIGDRRGIASSLNNLGNVALALGKHTEAKQLYQESLAIRNEIGDRLGMAYCMGSLGEVATALGECAEAREHLREALKMGMEIRSLPALVDCLGAAASLLARTDEKQRAVELLALVLHHSASLKRRKDKAEQLLAELKSKLPPEVVTASQQKGRGRDPEEVAKEILLVA